MIDTLLADITFSFKTLEDGQSKTDFTRTESKPIHTSTKHSTTVAGSVRPKQVFYWKRYANQEMQGKTVKIMLS